MSSRSSSSSYKRADDLRMDDLDDRDWDAIARVFFAVHQRRAEQAAETTAPALTEPGTATTNTDVQPVRPSQGRKRRVSG